MSTLLYLVRHGQTDWNADRRYQGHAPVPLNDVGQAQAAALGNWFASHETVEVIYSSDLARCLATAQAVAERLGLPVQPDRRLREINVGLWQGMTREQHEEYDPENYAAHRADPFNVPMPGGESFAMVLARMRSLLDEVLERHQGGRVMLVSHGGVIRTLLQYYQVEPPGLRIPNTSVAKVSVPPNGSSVALLQAPAITHLPPELVPARSDNGATGRI